MSFVVVNQNHETVAVFAEDKWREACALARACDGFVKTEGAFDDGRRA